MDRAADDSSTSPLAVLNSVFSLAIWLVKVVTRPSASSNCFYASLMIESSTPLVVSQLTWSQSYSDSIWVLI